MPQVPGYLKILISQSVKGLYRESLFFCLYESYDFLYCISYVIKFYFIAFPSIQNINYIQSFVYCRVFVLLIIDYSTKKGVLVYSRKCASEIVYFRTYPDRKQCELMC